MFNLTDSSEFCGYNITSQLTKCINLKPFDFFYVLYKKAVHNKAESITEFGMRSVQVKHNSSLDVSTWYKTVFEKPHSICESTLPISNLSLHNYVATKPGTTSKSRIYVEAIYHRIILNLHGCLFSYVKNKPYTTLKSKSLHRGMV